MTSAVTAVPDPALAAGAGENRHAEVPHGTGASPGTMTAGALGNMLEWYDFGVYGFFATLFAQNFFPASDPLAGLLAAFGVFAASFLMRPIGGIVFGHVGDRYGRSVALYVSAGMMTLSTVAIGLLPTYATIGEAAPLALLGLRLLQGLSIGGEYSMSAIFLAESAPPRRRGLVTSLAGCGVGGGTLIGSGTAALTASLMSPEDLAAWGWRLPFLAGIVLGGATLVLRRAALAHPAPRKPIDEARGLPFVAALREDGRAMLHAMVLNLALGSGFYVLFVYLTTFMQQVDRFTAAEALRVNTLAMLGLLVMLPLFAGLSDIIGRKKVIVGALAGMVMFTWPLFRLINGGDPQQVLLGQLGFAVLTAAYSGSIPATLAEMFRPATRCSALCFAYNLPLGLVGGTAPMVAVYLVDRQHDPMGPAVYLIGIALLSLLAALALKDRTGTALN
ncbi:MFS transporter [Ancylobacter terrae]|uniref:MFS transporter n=1 Tax=Ancylobacter sp. sgz301288 TaxID=3342077 RepID=UPI00385BB0F5